MNHEKLIEDPSVIWDEESRGPLEPNALAEVWTDKRFRDQIISDMVHMLDQDGGFGGDSNALSVYWPGGGAQLGHGAKSSLARSLVGLIAERWDAKRSAESA